MSELINAVQTIGGPAVVAYLAKDGLQKLLGPTADYLGEGLKNLTQRRAETVGRIFQSATEKLGDSLTHNGEVPPKVLRLIVNEASYANDPLAIEYFGGILASARTEQGRDDRGARWAKIADQMSSYQLRAHYLIYSAIQKEFASAGLTFSVAGTNAMQIFIPNRAFEESMDFGEQESASRARLYDHIFFGLQSDSLLGWWHHDTSQKFREMGFSKEKLNSDEDGTICQATVLGAELFMSALGMADKPLEAIFETASTLNPEGLPKVLSGVERIRYQQS